MIPFYMRYQVTSAYELLEITLGVPVRITGAIMFIVLRLVWMSLLIFFASKAMIVMLGISDAWLPLVTFVTGAVAIVYASLGGLRAVVITDLMQFILLFLTSIVLPSLVTMKPQSNCCSFINCVMTSVALTNSSSTTVNACFFID